MCKPLSDYLRLLREYTREAITYGGFALAVFVYMDFRTLVREQTATNAVICEKLRDIDLRLATLEHTKK